MNGLAFRRNSSLAHSHASTSRVITVCVAMKGWPGEKMKRKSQETRRNKMDTRPTQIYGDGYGIVRSDEAGREASGYLVYTGKEIAQETRTKHFSCKLWWGMNLKSLWEKKGQENSFSKVLFYVFLRSNSIHIYHKKMAHHCKSVFSAILFSASLFPLSSSAAQTRRSTHTCRESNIFSTCKQYCAGSWALRYAHVRFIFVYGT